MKKLRLLIITLSVLVFAFSMLPSLTHPDTFTFSPSPSDLGDLDHNYYYTWGIKWNLPSSQAITETDNEGGDKFIGKDPLLGDSGDPSGTSPLDLEPVYTTHSTSFSCLSDGNFGFGIDPDRHYYPDCHDYNDAPEPATLLLLGSGLVGLAGLARRKFRKKTVVNYEC